MSIRLLNLLPEEGEALSRLWLNATDAARVCGVTVRQLTYWTDKGIIPTHPRGARTYGVSALEKVIAIKRAMLKGHTLEKAARLVEQASQSASDATTENLPAPEAYLEALIAALANCRSELPAYLALSAFKRKLTLLGDLDLGSLLAQAECREEAASLVAARLNEASQMLDAVLASLRRDLAPAAAAVDDVVGDAADEVALVTRQ